MKNNQLVCSLILLGGVSFSGVALANHGHRGHGGFELSIGVPFYASPYYSYPYGYYPPPAVVMPAQPQVYIQQDNPPPAPQASNFWYHCNQPEGYYPYVKECPAGWQKVSPTPPGSN
jgi:hypothetical protein